MDSVVCLITHIVKAFFFYKILFDSNCRCGIILHKVGLYLPRWYFVGLYDFTQFYSLQSLAENLLTLAWTVKGWEAY